MTYQFTTQGTCSRAVQFDIDEQGILHNVKFAGGCPGNTVGVALLCEGMPATAAIERLRGIPCRDKTTSCPDQLAQAIEKALIKK